MKKYDSTNIRNIALLGHAGSGKTTLAESMAYQAGMINRKGAVEDGNTVSDFHPLEQERTNTIFSTPIAIEFSNVKLNVLDTPGYDDYLGEACSAASVADAGMVVVNAHNGIEVGTENGWSLCGKDNKPVVFVVNKLDFDQADFDATLDEVKSAFGHGVTAFQYPLNAGQNIDTVIDILANKAYKFNDKNVETIDVPASEADKVESLRSEIIEMIAESDEDLMNKYFEEGDLSEEDINKGLKAAFLSRSIFPVFCASTKTNVGVEPIMNFIKNVVPNPTEVAQRPADEEAPAVDSSEKVSLFVFKMISEAHLGDMTFFKVQSGTMKGGLDLYNENKSAQERFGQIFVMSGKNRTEISELAAGDIGATVKLKSTQINHTIEEKGMGIKYDAIQYPNPKVRIAVVPKTKGEEEKVGMGLNAIHTEDPSLVVEHSQELRQLIIHAQGELHLGVTKWRLENRYKVEVEYIAPKVPYRETIQKEVRGSFRHKKQSGGAGQFAEVHMLLAPWSEGMANPDGIPVRGKELMTLDWGGKLEYINSIVGGVIDQRFLPAILKGVMEKMEFGPLTGSYARDIRVIIYDGKMHPVDSNEAAFKMAGARVFSENFIKASPKLLEPVYEVAIKCPEEFVGDIMSDLPSRRGMILGIDAEGRYQTVNATMPLAELDKYATALRSMTQARASYTATYKQYEAVPANIQEELIAEYKKSQEEE